MYKIYLILFLLLINVSSNVSGRNSKIEFLRREFMKNEGKCKNDNSISQKKHFNKPIINATELINGNKTYEFIDLYREISMIKSNSELPIKKAFIDSVLIPKADAKIAKLKAETAYIETKNAAKKKSMNLIAEDFKKQTPFANLTAKLLNISIPINDTELLNSIYNETFYYFNNKNGTNYTEFNS